MERLTTTARIHTLTDVQLAGAEASFIAVVAVLTSLIEDLREQVGHMLNDLDRLQQEQARRRKKREAVARVQVEREKRALLRKRKK